MKAFAKHSGVTKRSGVTKHSSGLKTRKRNSLASSNKKTRRLLRRE